MTLANGDLGAAPLHTLPVAQRPKRTIRQTINALLFFVFFEIGCLLIVFTQFCFVVPLRILPFSFAREAYRHGIRYTKGAFGNLLILMNQCFAPTKLVVTFETEGMGKFTREELREMVIRDRATDDIIGLRLPNKAVIIGNHQVYSDWWYAWNLTHFMGMSKDIYIVLKRSLKWVPIIGWGMQLYEFIFLARSWNSDKLLLSSSLANLAKRAEKEDLPLAFLLYPEGTLVSKDTRPVSKKFADKEGIPDMTNMLLPRSTGLHYSLRSLSPRIPTLHLLDITVAYPGIPRLGYGQDYYTLRSIFFDRVPPPEVHMHIRRFDVARDVPIGDVSGSNSDTLPRPGDANAVEVVVPERERIAFEQWLRALWREKDKDVDRFLDMGVFVKPKIQSPVKIPLELRSWRQVLDAYCFFLPALAGYVGAKFGGGR